MSTQTGKGGSPRFATATIRQHLARVANRHVRNGYLGPTGHKAVSDLVRGLAKLRTTQPVRKRALLLDDVVGLIASMDHDVDPNGVSAARDSVALWLGLAGALRRSEAAGLQMNSLELHRKDGIHVHVGASKADQENAELDVVLLPFGSTAATCAPCAAHRWVALGGIAQEEDASQRRRGTSTDLALGPRLLAKGS